MNPIRLLRPAALLAALVCVAPLCGQTIREEVLRPVEHSAGSSMAYRFEAAPQTPAPEGYRPFYIGHFGRHGSRYHTTEHIYRKFRDLFAEADRTGALTPLGRDVRQRMDTIFARCDGHAGVLTPRGEEEHRAIAGRMYDNYPEVFAPSADGRRVRIFARSTSVERVVLSMRAFDAELARRAPHLKVEEAPGGAHNAYLNHYTPEYKEYYRDGAWRAIYERQREQWIAPERLVASLFGDGEFVRRRIAGQRNFMTELFSLASILQDCPVDETLYDLFTDDEIYALWRLQNLNQYLRKGPSALAGELAASIARPLLRDLLACADAAVAGDAPAADLRFGHGEGLMPLAALMRLEGACGAERDPEQVELAWQDFRITPMAGNIQWILYRNAQSDVLVKFLLNERETRIPIRSATGLYYRWRDVRRFYARIARD
ncbi:histidine phosphatase family protein [uncultured Alistipes sp.]|uniref:histidine phosphatase family protein n=1 Tax=uncultured Alistipes sp. TaxID=538949 RepID=UPI002638E1D0|nr:histidine phosphatase family protein [uncultured Alistipes sp.]